MDGVMRKTSLLITSTITGLLVFSNVFADNTNVMDQINITVPISCTMSGTGMNTHNAEILNGDYASNIGETIIKAFCNDNNGFAIYAIGYTDDIYGKNVLTDSTLDSTYDIITGTAMAPVGGNDVSNWAMKLSTLSSPAPTYPLIIAGSTDDIDKEQGDLDYSMFQEVPNNYTKVAYRKFATDINPSGQDTAEGSTLKTTYQAYISRAQPAGTYVGQVKYTLVHPHNGATPEIPMGLCTDSQTCMQQSTSVSLAQQLPNVGDTVTLYDARDNQAYTVAKLADGKYWMTENLNIAGGTALSSNDTDFDSNYTLPTTGGWTVSDGKLILPASAIKNSEDNNLTDETQFSEYNYAYVFNSGNKTNCGGISHTIPCYSYYSWDSATVGSGRNVSSQNTDALYSICPKGWKLPKTRSTSATNWQTESDFYALAHQYGLDSTTQVYESDSDFYNQAGPSTTPNFLLSGYYGNGTFSIGNPIGYYWPSTSASANTTAIRFAVRAGYVNAGSAGVSRRNGYSVRCLFAN